MEVSRFAGRNGIDNRRWVTHSRASPNSFGLLGSPVTNVGLGNRITPARWRRAPGEKAARIWGGLMSLEMIVDHWNPSLKKYRYETFCYVPKSCAIYRAGPTRKVPGRKGMSYTEEDWVDEDATSHWGADD